MNGKKFNASSYRKHRQESLETYDEVLPSGFTFKLCRVELVAYFSSGKLPATYIEKLISFSNKTANEIESIVKSMSIEEQFNNLKFMAHVIKSACVEPKIVENPENDNEIRFEDIDDKDLVHIFHKSLGVGGEQAEHIGKFR